MQSIIRRAPAQNALRAAFTGYRPAKMPFGYSEADPRCVDFKDRLMRTLNHLVAQGYTHFLSGCAMGMDIWGGEAVRKIQRTNPIVTLEMVSPFDAQAERWSEEYRARRKALIDAADMVTVISNEYTPTCIFMRNRYLVVNADLLIAAYDGQEGGTRMTINLAYREGVPVLTLPPQNVGRQIAMLI